MTFADEEEFAAFVGRDDWLPTMTGDAVASAMEGFALSLVPDRDMSWLATATRRALALTVKAKGEGPDRASNSEIRAELGRLSEAAATAWQKIFDCSVAADYRIWTVASHHWDGEGGTDVGGGMTMGEPSDYVRFNAAVAELDWLARFLRLAALETEPQRGPWRQSEERRIRVERGLLLAPIFEAAFGQPVSANNWPSGTHKEPSAFMDFYQRMVALAFNERATPDISGVLKSACQMHRKYPAQFAKGVIPGL